MFIKDKAKVASRVVVAREVMYFRKLLFKSDKKLSFRRVESQKV